MSVIRAVLTAGAAFAVFWLVLAFAFGVAVGTSLRRRETPVESEPATAPEPVAGDAATPESAAFGDAIVVPRNSHVVIQHDWATRRH